MVSEPVVAAMAESAMRQAGADIAIAVSGNAGPTAPEGTPATACLALVRRSAARPLHTETLSLPGLSRKQFRQRVATRALELVLGSARG